VESAPVDPDGRPSMMAGPLIVQVFLIGQVQAVWSWPTLNGEGRLWAKASTRRRLGLALRRSCQARQRQCDREENEGQGERRQV
jgi:hypothetical protein